MWAKVESIRGKVVNVWITWPSNEEEVFRFMLRQGENVRLKMVCFKDGKGGRSKNLPK